MAADWRHASGAPKLDLEPLGLPAPSDLCDRLKGLTPKLELRRWPCEVERSERWESARSVEAEGLQGWLPGGPSSGSELMLLAGCPISASFSSLKMVTCAEAAVSQSGG